MKTKIEIKSRFGKILFEFEKEDNTIKKTVEHAIKSGANLTGADLYRANLTVADLSGADLSGANLSGANLYRADLSGADLTGADLTVADLTRADLTGANLSGADLSGANLTGADLYRADLSGADLYRVKIKKCAVFTGIYKYVVIPIISEEGEKYVTMGCYLRKLSEWEADFWNNPNEFPNDNSEKSNLRLFAFETAKKWFDVIDK